MLISLGLIRFLVQDILIGLAIVLLLLFIWLGQARQLLHLFLTLSLPVKLALKEYSNCSQHHSQQATPHDHSHRDQV